MIWLKRFGYAILAAHAVLVTVRAANYLYRVMSHDRVDNPTTI